ncbi:P27 family phage terminase small subunit [Actinomadura rudentiformis]|uniref:P27 family phage terminase small subunit n=1 Tax=Actinomadura rudentiformis TaxID=359158 RepID=A0A6H9YU99_9ACTN|nr:P27 family phage terminase small subunit [Actinomadura rudentiformis]KAB2344868.1 P27 family phage terminase small subunit [Actinomadura rudentiformis]
MTTGAKLDGGKTAAVEPPGWLADEARSVWAQLAPVTAPGTLTAATAAAFALLCTAVATYAESDQLVQEAGMLIAEGQALVPNPALAIRSQADGTFGRWAREFGLTPDSQTPADAGPRGARHLREI